MQNYLNCTRSSKEAAKKSTGDCSLFFFFSTTFLFFFLDFLASKAHANAKRKWQTNHNVTTAAATSALGRK